jgi:hypothetical protein
MLFSKCCCQINLADRPTEVSVLASTYQSVNGLSENNAIDYKRLLGVAENKQPK